MRDYPDSQLIALDVDGKIETLHYAGLTQTRRVINGTMHRDLSLFVPLTVLGAAGARTIGPIALHSEMAVAVGRQYFRLFDPAAADEALLF